MNSGIKGSCEGVLREAVYGLSEWKRSEIQKANLIANPGCFATAALLAILPLVRSGIIEEDSIIIDAKSGVSGAGKTPTTMTHFPELYDNLRIYKVNEHQHVLRLSKCSRNGIEKRSQSHLVHLYRYHVGLWLHFMRK